MSFLISGFFALPVTLFSMLRWRLGFLGLLCYVPFAGAISLWLYPSPVGVLLKDFLFVLPVYVGLFLLGSNALNGVRVPNGVIWTVVLLSTIAVLQSFNPAVPSFVIALIGLKVWLLYIPLIFVTAAWLDTYARLIQILRLLVILATIPCMVGLFQFFLAKAIGYQEAIELFYGPAAQQATQEFSRFYYGGELIRVPSTFTFVTQYFGFTLAMMVPAFVLMRIDPTARWRTVAGLTLLLIITASLLSGARAAFVFVPLLLGVVLWLDGRVKGIMAGVILVPAVTLAALHLGGLDPQEIFGATRELTYTYTTGVVSQGPLQAFLEHPLGTGTGMNTGAARYGLEPGERLSGIESYYAKVIVEFGALGLIAFAMLIGAIILAGWRSMSSIEVPQLRTCAAALVGFVVVMAINSGKGWLLDIDPINIYFWVFLGILFKLPDLERSQFSSVVLQQNSSPLRIQQPAESP